MKKHILATLLFSAIATTAMAQDLVYQPVNPSFGGNPFNSAHLLALANAQNDYERPVEEASSQSDLDRFVRSLQSRLLSSLSTQVANAIFGENAQDQGRIIFGDQTIEFVRTLDGIQLTITEADGSQTVITIPVFTTGDDEDDPDDSSSKTTAVAENKALQSPNISYGTQLAEQKSNSTLFSDPLLASSGEQPIR